MTAPSTRVTTLLTEFGMATAAEDLVPRLTQAGHHAALPVLLEVFEAEADARRERRTTWLRRASRRPPGKTFATLDSGREFSIDVSLIPIDTEDGPLVIA